MEQQNYHRQIISGDVLEKLADIPDGIIDCIITSPPYWALRDYSVDGQWGLEKTFDEYLSKMKLLMAQLHRVLKNTGTCWINLGDTYSTVSGGMKNIHDKKSNDSKHGYLKENIAIDQSRLYTGLKAKSRIGIPERFYINCIDSGWIARNDITWIKWNAMPQSVKDRFTNKKETVYFFAKNQKYYFNLDAVKIATQNDSKSYHIHKPDYTNTAKQQTLWCVGENDYTDNDSDDNDSNYDTITEKYDKDSNVGRLHKDRIGNPNNKQDSTLGSDGKAKANYAGFNDRWKVQNQHRDSLHYADSDGYNTKGKNPGDLIFANYSDQEILQWIKLCRNNLSAWDMAPPDIFCINPKPMPDAHFATFPVALPQRILKCACPKQVCVKCGYPKIPISKPTEQYQKVLDSIIQWQRGGLQKGLSNYKKDLESLTAQHEIVGYDTCECNDEFIPGIVLDPFFGAGTTGIAAEIEGVRWCGIEIKQEYCTIARERLKPYVNQEALIV